MELNYTLVYDEEKSDKYENYYQYRSQKYEGNRPIIDGVYIQWQIIGQDPPRNMELKLSWK